jgi:hypothetical protein
MFRRRSTSQHDVTAGISVASGKVVGRHVHASLQEQLNGHGSATVTFRLWCGGIANVGHTCSGDSWRHPQLAGCAMNAVSRLTPMADGKQEPRLSPSFAGLILDTVVSKAAKY